MGGFARSNERPCKAKKIKLRVQRGESQIRVETSCYGGEHSKAQTVVIYENPGNT